MAVTFNELLEGTNLSEEARESIQEAWESRLDEAREELTAELREEFAQRYEHDKGLIVEAVDNFISTRVEAEVSELAEDKKALAEERVKYRKAIGEHAKVLDRFVTEMVAKEVKELHADRNRVSEHLNKLDGFVADQLAEELIEFHEDKKALVEQKVKMVREGKRQLAETKKDFISRAAEKVEKVVNATMASEIATFKDDITAARENDFGRRLFEAFASEYNSSYLNETKEIRKVQKSLAEMKSQLAEAQAKIEQREEAVHLTESRLRVAEDKYARKEKLDELMKPLSREKKEIMSDLLESVKTEKLEGAFNKYLPSVISEDAPRAKKTLNESVTSSREVTGNKEETVLTESQNNEAETSAEIIEIRKLAGL